MPAFCQKSLEVDGVIHISIEWKPHNQMSGQIIIVPPRFLAKSTLAQTFSQIPLSPPAEPEPQDGEAATPAAALPVELSLFLALCSPT
jgi:hypothetical protein